MQEVKWKYEIGDRFIDYKENGSVKRDLIIIDKQIKVIKHKNKHNASGFQMSRMKYYKYSCNICGWDEGWIEEQHLNIRKQGCSCCAGKTTVKGINDIATTHPHLMEYFKNKEDAFLYQAHSDACPILNCPRCGYIKTNLKIDTLTKYGFGCQMCSDGISYNEKFIHSLLSQLNVEHRTQLTKIQ